MPLWRNALLLIAATTPWVGASAIVRCELNGKPVNPSNGAETAGLTGLLRCREEDTGRLQREQELQNGKFLGLERFYDREGRLARERRVNERGNSQGRVAEFWPNGQLRREELAENGRTQGPVRRFSEQGKLERLSFHGEGRELFYAEYNGAGQIMRLQCHAASVLPEDRKPCGFEGAVDTVLYTASGDKAAQMRYEQGRLLAATEWSAGGVLAAQQLRENGRRVHRQYTTEEGKAVLCEERIYEADERALPDRRGLLAQTRRWGASGQLTEQRAYVAGREVLLERWYLNGALRERTALSSEGAAARILRELHDDEGQIARRERLTAEQQPTGVQQYYHPNGRLAREDTYGSPDAQGRTRLQARKEWDPDGQLQADDVLLEDGSRQHKAGGQLGS